MARITSGLVAHPVRETYFEPVPVEEVLKQIAEGTCVSIAPAVQEPCGAADPDFPYPRKGAVTVLWMRYTLLTAMRATSQTAPKT
jgi:hypothetical protein